jgi:hypothetical protein
MGLVVSGNMDLVVTTGNAGLVAATGGAGHPRSTETRSGDMGGDKQRRHGSKATEL